jgi:starvation-inducible DNA-binding protein
MKTDTRSTEEGTKGVVHILNENLCDEYLLYTKTRHFHWNVTGPQFAALHEFFEKQYRQLDDMVDEVAERARALGGWPPGTMTEFLERSHLSERPGGSPDAQAMTAELAGDHESIVKRLRGDIATCEKKYRDAGTANFLCGLMERHEKMAWMLRAHQAPEKRESARARYPDRRALELKDDPSGAGE